MRYLRCVISKPSLFSNRSLEFSDSLTIVNGKNGSGKSFLARCLVDGIWKLFSGSAFLREEAWQDMYLDISFALPHPLSVVETFRIKYQADNLSVISDGEKEEIILSGKAGQEWEPGTVFAQLNRHHGGDNLAQFFSSNDKAIFINSSYIPSPSDIGNDVVLDYSTIKNIILRDGSGYFSFHNYIKNSYTRAGVVTNPFLQKIDYYEKELKSLSKEIELIEIKNLRTSKLKKERSIIESEIGQLKDKLEKNNEKKRIIAKIGADIARVAELNGELDSIKNVVTGEQEKIEKVSGLENEIHIKFSQFKDLGITDEINLDSIQEVFRDIINLNEKIDKFFFSRGEKRRKLKKMVTAVYVAAGTAILYILYHDSFSITGHPVILSSIAGFAFLFAPTVYLYSYFSTRVKKLVNLNNQKAELEQKLKKLLLESSLRFDNYRLSELYELLLQYFEDYIEFTEHQRELKDLKGSLREKKELKEIQKDLSQLKKKEDEIKEEIAANMKSLALEDELFLEQTQIDVMLEKIDGEIEETIGGIEKKEQVLQRIDDEMSVDPDYVASNTELIKERDRVREILKGLHARKEVMLYIAGLMEEAVVKREKDQLKKLIDSTLGVFHTLTGNQYIARVNDAVAGDFITGDGLIHDLNPAVVHTLLLSIKFSLTDFLLDSGVSLPLIIDDPFLFMDDDRIGHLKNQINIIAQKRQVIIFTHKKQDNDWGKLIEL